MRPGAVELSSVSSASPTQPPPGPNGADPASVASPSSTDNSRRRNSPGLPTSEEEYRARSASDFNALQVRPTLLRNFRIIMLVALVFGIVRTISIGTAHWYSWARGAGVPLAYLILVWFVRQPTEFYVKYFAPCLALLHFVCNLGYPFFLFACGNVTSGGRCSREAVHFTTADLVANFTVPFLLSALLGIPWRWNTGVALLRWVAFLIFSEWPNEEGSTEPIANDLIFFFMGVVLLGLANAGRDQLMGQIFWHAEQARAINHQVALATAEARIEKEARHLAEVLRERSAKAELAKEELLNFVCHELRVPFNAIALGVEQLTMMEQGHETIMTNSSDRIDTVNHMRRSCDSVTHLLDDIVEFANIGLNNFAVKMAWFRLEALIQMETANAEALLTPKNIRLNVYVDTVMPRLVWGDERRLRQVLGNFFSNAAQFASAGSTAELRVTVIDSAWLQFSVRDEGVGISPTGLERLFKAYQSVASGGNHVQSTGLGLAICKHITDVHQGNIWCESELNKGSTFFFRIPLRDDEPTDNTSPASASPTESPFGLNPRVVTHANLRRLLHNVRVLVVEDSTSSRRMLTKLLRRLGAKHVGEAEHGARAVEMMVEEGEAFDLVIMDKEMPVMDGCEATRRLRAFQPDLPILGLTASVMPQNLKQFMASGLSSVTSKPLQQRVLQAELEKFREFGGAPPPAPAEPESVEIPLDVTVVSPTMENRSPPRSPPAAQDSPTRSPTAAQDSPTRSPTAAAQDEAVVPENRSPPRSPAVALSSLNGRVGASG